MLSQWLAAFNLFALLRGEFLLGALLVLWVLWALLARDFGNLGKAA